MSHDGAALFSLILGQVDSYISVVDGGKAALGPVPVGRSAYTQDSHDCVSLRVKQTVILLGLGRHMAHWSYKNPPFNFPGQWHLRN